MLFLALFVLFSGLFATGHHHSRISKEDTALVIQLAGGSVINAFDCNISQSLIVICSNPKDCSRRQVYLPAQVGNDMMYDTGYFVKCFEQ